MKATKLLAICFLLVAVIQGCKKDPIEGPDPPPPVLTGTACCADSVIVPSTITISWQSNATLVEVFLMETGEKKLSSSVPTGSESFFISSTSTFVVMFKRQDATDAQSCSDTVRIIGVPALIMPTISAEINPSTVPSEGGMVQLSWFAKNADEVLYEGQSLPPEGSMDVFITETCEKTLIARNENGEKSVTVFVTVLPALTLQEILSSGAWGILREKCEVNGALLYDAWYEGTCKEDDIWIWTFGQSQVEFDPNVLLCEGESGQKFVWAYTLEEQETGMTLIGLGKDKHFIYAGLDGFCWSFEGVYFTQEGPVPSLVTQYFVKR